MKTSTTTWIPWGLLGVGLLGFVDAAYLTLKHYTKGDLACSVTAGCDVVTTSAYSEILGVPVALLGALYYLAMVLAMVAYADTKDSRIVRLASFATIGGLVASAYFVSVQAFVLSAWCQYCLASAVTSTLLFVLGMAYLRRTRSTSSTPTT